MHRQAIGTTHRAEDSVIAQAAAGALKQAILLAREFPPGEAFRRLTALREACARVSDCIDGQSARSERDAYELAQARARILLNKIALMEADANRVRADGDCGYQKSGSAG